jgi:SSS family solute:Na+ symporter/sodium/pantothenate symporter
MRENALAEPHPAMLAALVLFTAISLGLGVVANLATRKKAGFLRRYFLGNRSLGAFAVALTAAVMSGGTFMGFPSLVYTFGWVVGLWIASYMIAPITILGLLGKRVGQLSRRTGAITLPDFFRERFGSPALGLLTSLIVIVFVTVNLVPQFKAGAILVKSVMPTPANAWASGVLQDVWGAQAAGWDSGYLLGLLLFSATVVAYTAYGGFLAAIWTDVFQSLVMAAGVLILLPLAIGAAGGLNEATIKGMELAGGGFGFGPGAGRAFHPLTLAISFFFMWAISGAGQPSTLVRLMAFRDARTLRFSILYLALYNAVVYIPLILIFVCSRSILPELAAQPGGSDEVMPALVKRLANPYVAGFILAAPYGAVMSTVSGFLLIVSSGLVRDVYQRFLRPAASEREVAVASYAGTVLVGVVVMVRALDPPRYLQLLVVFAGSGLAASFLVPALMAAYWRRATAAGAFAAMAGGALTTMALYAIGSYGPAEFGLDGLLPPNPEIGAPSRFRPYYLLGFDPCVWGLAASAAAGVLVSLLSRVPDPARVALLFDPQPPGAPAPATLALHPEAGPRAADG